MDKVSQLFPRAPEAIQLSAYWDFSQGWSFRIAVRRSGLRWDGADERTYEGLVSEELLDVVACELARVLGLKD